LIPDRYSQPEITIAAQVGHFQVADTGHTRIRFKLPLTAQSDRRSAAAWCSVAGQPLTGHPRVSGFTQGDIAGASLHE